MIVEVSGQRAREKTCSAELLELLGVATSPTTTS